MKKFLKKRYIFMILAVLLLLSVVGFSSAWLAVPKSEADPQIDKGMVIQQYFHCGTGTATDPFVITRPIHYYHLVELYQRRSGFAGNNYYFQLGYEFVPGSGTYQVYKYDDTGSTDGTLSTSLNMAYYSDELSLLPVGTSDVPFNGTFDGNSLAINNLSIVPSETIGGQTYSTCDVGVFGYLGADASVSDLYITNATIHLENMNITNINPTGHNADIHLDGATQVAYVGYIAGHVKHSTSVENVYIDNCKILGGSEATSNFGYFGAVENSSGQMITTLGEQIGEETNTGDGAGWGGSLDMNLLYNRLYDIADEEASSNSEYVTAETVVLSRNGTIISRFVTGTASISNFSSMSYLHYGSDVAGSYTYNRRNGYSPWIYLTGANSRQSKVVTTYQETDSDLPAYLIADERGNKFLGVTRDLKIGAVSEDIASRWEFSGTSISVQIGLTRYYLNRDGNSLVLNTTATTAWSKGTNTITTTGDGVTYYLIYDHIWKLSTAATSFVIHDGAGHYLSCDGSAITNETSQGAATEWTTFNEGSSYYFTANGNYLGFQPGTGLIASPTKFGWMRKLVKTVDGVDYYAYYVTVNSLTWYLAYDSGWNAVLTSGYSIKCTSGGATHILGTNAKHTEIADKTAIDYSALWQFDPSKSSTAIAMNYNGQIKYLGFDSGTGELTLSATPTTWNKSTDNGTRYYVEYNGKTYFLTYEESWCVMVSNKQVISAGGKYLQLDFNAASSLGYTTNVNGANISWEMDGDNHLYMTNGGTRYYLCVDSDGTVTVKYPTESWTVANATAWQTDSDGLFTDFDGWESHLVFDNGWKLENIYKHITNGDPSNSSSHFLHLVTTDGVNSATIDDDSGSSRDTLSNRGWQMRDGYIFCGINGTRYYLTSEGQNKKPILVSDKSSASVWSTQAASSQPYSGNQVCALSTTYSGVTYNLECVGGVWRTNRGGAFRIYFESSTLEDSSNSRSYMHNLMAKDANTLADTYYSSDVRSHWYVDSNGRIYIDSSGSRRYLIGSKKKTLSIGAESNATLFKFDDIGIYYRINALGGSSAKFYITYNESTKTWESSIRRWYSFRDPTTGLYLQYNASDSTASTSTTPGREWNLYTRSDGNTYLYFVSGGSARCMGWNGSKIVFSTVSDLTTDSNQNLWWTIESGGLRTNNDTNKYLIYDGSKWTCGSVSSSYYNIQSGSTYLGIDSSGAVTNTNTTWAFSGNATAPGIISASSGSNVYYLNNNAGALEVSTTNRNTSWQYDSELGSYYSVYNSTNYYLAYDATGWITSTTGWKLTTLRYLISSNGYYMTQGTTGSRTYRNKNLPSTTDMKSACQFTFTNTGAAPSGYISAANGTLWMDYSWLLSNNYLEFVTRNSSAIKWKNTNGKLSPGTSSYYLTLASDNGWDITSSGTTLTFTPTASTIIVSSVKYSPVQIGEINSTNRTGVKTNWSVETNVVGNESMAGVCAKLGTSAGSTNPLNIALEQITTLPSVATASRDKSYNVSLVETKAPQYVLMGTSNQKSGLSTYIPLRLEIQDENDKESYYSDYRVSSKNTGYIVSGANETQSSYQADIRVSRYDTSDIYRSLNTSSGSAPTFSDSYNARLQVVTKTYKSGGNYVRIKDSHNASNISSYNSYLPSTAMDVSALGLDKYNDSRLSFKEMLSGTNRVYGLHFMDATISQSNVVIADQVTVMGKTYTNYELPEDCIDCYLIGKGAINFFAGTYYSSNVETFFSLHQIFRDGNEHITAIKEISKVYKHKTSNDMAYVYRYSDGTYSNSNYTDSNIGTDYTMIFDTEWITNPSIIQNTVYYFEIPVNRGEYALGSVADKTGAYLLYLDIAANGDEDDAHAVSLDGNGVTNMYAVDTRSVGDTSPYALMQFSFKAPVVSNPNAFTVSTSFTKSGVEAEYAYGKYTITIVNYSGKDVELSVLLSDDDVDVSNDYLYAYEIIYTNSTMRGEYVHCETTGKDYWKAMNTFIIPATGEAYVRGRN